MQIGETIGASNPEALDLIHIDEPTVSVDFIVNTGPWVGAAVSSVTMRNISTG